MAMHNYARKEFMINPLNPLYDRILVKVEPLEEKTSGGIYLPESSKEKSHTGVVISTGSGRVSLEGKTIPLEIQAGDKIIFSKHAGVDLNFSDDQFIMMREEDVLGVLT